MKSWDIFLRVARFLPEPRKFRSLLVIRFPSEMIFFFFQIFTALNCNNNSPVYSFIHCNPSFYLQVVVFCFLSSLHWLKRSLGHFNKRWSHATASAHPHLYSSGREAPPAYAHTSVSLMDHWLGNCWECSIRFGCDIRLFCHPPGAKHLYGWMETDRQHRLRGAVQPSTETEQGL